MQEVHRNFRFRVTPPSRGPGNRRASGVSELREPSGAPRPAGQRKKRAGVGREKNRRVLMVREARSAGNEVARAQLLCNELLNERFVQIYTRALGHLSRPREPCHTRPTELFVRRGDGVMTASRSPASASPSKRKCNGQRLLCNLSSILEVAAARTLGRVIPGGVSRAASINRSNWFFDN